MSRPCRRTAPGRIWRPSPAPSTPCCWSSSDAERLKGLPIYLAHGALDWMFPVGIARAARDAFSARGAAVTYRELPDLAHAFPTEECAAVLAWLKDTPTVG